MQFTSFIVDKQRIHKSLYAFFMDDEQIKYSLEYETIYFWIVINSPTSRTNCFRSVNFFNWIDFFLSIVQSSIFELK